MHPNTAYTTKISQDNRFTSLGKTRRIMAISAIHGDIDRLKTLHDAIYEHIQPGDHIVYTGNYIGYGESSVAVIDELLAFRRAVLAKQGVVPSDLIYLRGAQEEMWQKLLQLQFAPDPMNAFLWMLGTGLSNTLSSYGLSHHDGIEACRQGIVGLSQWTSEIRRAFKSHAGHETFSTHLVRAAFTLPEDTSQPLLFVSAGIDPSKTLEEQGDSFWWANKKFNTIGEPYKPFSKIIRGYDPDHKGMYYGDIKATIDGGCGFGGTLICAVFDNEGNLIDSLEC